MSAGYADSRRRIMVANSDGVFAEDDVVRTQLYVQAVASGDTGMQTGAEGVGRTMGFEMFDDVDVEELGRTAAQRAIRKLRARPAPSGVVPIVIAAGRGAVLFHEACGHGLEADAIEKDASVYAGRVGEQVASPLVTLVDDGTMAAMWGASAIDDEGHPAQRNVLIENGVLTDYMWDFLRARKEGRASSGNGRRQTYQHLPMVRMTNTYLLAGGTDDPDEILRQTPHGVYIAQLGGGPGEHRDRRLRLRHDRGVPDRERRDHRSHPRRQPHRQRRRGPARHRRGGQRLRHGRRRRHVRQGGPECPGRHGPTHAARERRHCRRHGQVSPA